MKNAEYAIPAKSTSGKYLFAYFVGNEPHEERIHFAVSEDGYNFVSLNNNEPVILQTKGKLLGIDFGDKRTGLAVSDPSRILASGIGYISPGGIVKVADKIAEVCAEQRIVGIVLGLPVNMDGSQGFRADRIKELASLLNERMPDVPVAFFDERLSTMAATRFLNETNTRGSKRKGVVDTLSAQIILQNALDKLKYMSNN